EIIQAEKIKSGKNTEDEQVVQEINDQPGPSGITKAEIEEMIQAEKIRSGKEDPEDDKVEEEKKETNPITIFAEKVTIAGWEEAMTAKWKVDRIMFRIALILASIIIIYQSIEIAAQYKYQRTVFTNLEIMRDHRAPFPNVSICFPVVYNE